MLCDHRLHFLLGTGELFYRQRAYAPVHDRLIRNDVGLPKGSPSILTTVIGNSGTALYGPRVKRETVITFYFVVKGIENTRGFVNGTGAH